MNNRKFNKAAKSIGKRSMIIHDSYVKGLKRSRRRNGVVAMTLITFPIVSGVAGYAHAKNFCKGIGKMTKAVFS